MVKKTIARRYARALFSVLREEESRDVLTSTLRALEQFSQAFKENAFFRDFMLSPRFDREAKARALQKIMDQIQVRPHAARFLLILVRRNRFPLIHEIHLAFTALVDEFTRLLNVSVRTARDLSDKDQEAVRGRLESATGWNVQIRWQTDAALLGGMVLRIGETVVDGSLRGQLESIRKSFVEV